MAIEKLNEDLAFISRLPDEPNDEGGLSAAELKEQFDLAGLRIKSYINETLLPQLSLSGGDSIGLSPVPGLEGAKNIREALEKINNRVTDSVLGQIPDGSIGEKKLKPGIIGPFYLKDAAVEENKLAAGSVSGEKLRDSAVSGAKIASGAVGADKLGEASVQESKIQNGAVSRAKIASGAVDSEKLAELSVSHAKLGKAAVWGDNLAQNAVSGDKIAEGAVGGDKLKVAGETALGGVKAVPAGEEQDKFVGIDSEGKLRYKSLSTKLLWKNSAIGEFLPQSIPIDNSGKYLMLEFQNNMAMDRWKLSIIIRSDWTRGALVDVGWENTFRNFDLSPTAISFSDGYKVRNYGQRPENNNTVCIPTAVYSLY